MKKLLLCSLALVMIVVAIVGCGKSTSSSSATTKELAFNGETYTVPKDPQRIAVLSNSVLSMLYAVDGKAISRASTTDKLAPELEALPALGQTANINMEQLLGLKPDVVWVWKTNIKNMNLNYNLTIFQPYFSITMALRIMCQC